MIPYTVNDWNIGDIARRGRKSFVADPREWRAAVFEYGVEENTQASGKLHKVTGMP